MSYYPTLAEDITRAKAILERGKLRDEDLPEGADPHLRAVLIASSGNIIGMDVYAAFKLLESLVEAVEAVGVDVCQLAVRGQRRWRDG